jgi:hypothetical protein
LPVSVKQTDNRLVLTSSDPYVIKRNASAELVVEPFQPLCNVSLHWRGDRQLRALFEQELLRGLDEARTFDNPAAGWLLGVTGIMFGVMFLTGMVWVLIKYLPPRHW